MSAAEEAPLRRVTRTLYEIAQTLESTREADDRLNRLLVLLAGLVPYSRAALLRVTAHGEPVFVGVPPPNADERAGLLSELQLLLDVAAAGEAAPPPPRRRTEHLSLPVIGVDEIIGVIWVEHDAPGWRYDEEHLRLFALVAAQLGAYLTSVALFEQSAERTRELEAAHDFHQMLLGVVSHDLRNPLFVISSATQILQSKLVEEGQKKIVTRIMGSVRRAENIIADLLDVTHARVTGQMPVKRDAVDLRNLIEELIGDAQVVHPHREFEFIAAESSVIGDWDANRLAQMFGNLLANALRYGDPAHPIRVELLRDQGDTAVLAIQNRGPLIPPALLPGIFDPFKQGAQLRARAAGEGIGLGLYIVASLVRAHGGEVTVRSSDSEGTVFTVRLPLHFKASDAAVPPPPLILVVEDNAESRMGLSDALQRKGYWVEGAADGVQALQLLETLPQRPGAILLDLEMPRMDGWALREALRRDPRWKWIPIIVTSGDGLPSRLPADIQGFVPKPLDLKKVSAALEQFKLR